jgi:hypothetical protein
MQMTITYKAYEIETIEIEPGRIRARIKRSDKRKIHIVATDERKDDLTTGGQAAFSAQAAIDLAKQAIDGGGMN